MRYVKLALLTLVLGTTHACVVREVRPDRPYCGGHGAVWVGGWRGPHGYFHPGHWECR